jgi:hypothetical protein
MADSGRQGTGELYDQKKFDTPYIRDFLLDRGAIGDVSETAAPWVEAAAAVSECDDGPLRRSTPN